MRCVLLLSLALHATGTGIGLGRRAAVRVRRTRLRPSSDPGHAGGRDEIFLRGGLCGFDRAGELRPGKQAQFDAAPLVAAYAGAANLFHQVGAPDQAVGALENLTGDFPQAAASGAPFSTRSKTPATTLGLGDRADPETDRAAQVHRTWSPLATCSPAGWPILRWSSTPASSPRRGG